MFYLQHCIASPLGCVKDYCNKHCLNKPPTSKLKDFHWDDHQVDPEIQIILKQDAASIMASVATYSAGAMERSPPKEMRCKWQGGVKRFMPCEGQKIAYFDMFHDISLAQHVVGQKLGRIRSARRIWMHMIEYNANRTLDQRIKDIVTPSFFLQSASVLGTSQSNIPTSGHVVNRDMTRYITNASGPLHKHLGCGWGGIACWNPHLQSCAHLGSWKLRKNLEILERTCCKKFSQGHEVSLLTYVETASNCFVFPLSQIFPCALESGQELHDLHTWCRMAENYDPFFCQNKSLSKFPDMIGCWSGFTFPWSPKCFQMIGYAILNQTIHKLMPYHQLQATGRQSI